MRSHSAVLRAKMEVALPALWSLTQRLWAEPRLPALYPEYLCVMHQMIRATVPLMETTIEAASRTAGDDPVSRAVGAYLRKHIREEQGHDEWLRQDLAAVGHDPDTPLRRMPSPVVASLVGAQYYWVRHHHPVCLLGHIAVLEGYPPHPGLAQAIAERTGHSLAAFRTIRRHAVLDQRHRDELLAVIDALPLTPEHVAAMGLSALHTVRALLGVFEELLETPR